MATHAPPAADDQVISATARPSKAVIGVIGLGVAFGVFTALSGVVPLLTKWDDEDPVSREVFGGIPSPPKLAFYTLIPVLIVYGAFVFAQRVKNWERGGPDSV